MEKRKLQTKDLITVGIFTAIYFVLFFAGGMLGYIPILYVAIPVILPILGGIPFMLFLTRVKSFGMVTIMGTLLGGLMVITGHTFLPLIGTLDVPRIQIIGRVLRSQNLELYIFF